MIQMISSQKSVGHSTEELVGDALRGDQAAWRALVDRYARLVHSVPVRYGLTPEEVDDIGQEVFLALARNLHTIDDPERLPGWLVTTARRLSWRTRSRQHRESPDVAADLSEQDTLAGRPPFGTPPPSLAQLMAGWERQEMLGRALTQLRARCRELITLLFLAPDEPSYDEISERLDISKGSIGPTRTRCLAQLRAILTGLGYDADS
jgi:RNA polymerase sigma factor (sigma-70 family)